MAVSRNNIKWLLLILVGALLLAGVRAVGAQDKSDEDTAGMISISATTFEMGEAADVMLAECNLFRTGCEAGWFSSAQPIHTVQLDPFSIDMYEVTNEAFLEFINELDSVEEACDGSSCITLEDSVIEEGNDGLFDVDDELLTHPVAGATWHGANAYCESRGDRLPTEAEWELAAGWDFDAETKLFYPWGDEFDGSIVNFCDENCAEQQANDEFDDGFAKTAPVGSYEDGRSSAGLYDAGGNLWEWVDDWYDPSYYANSPEANPKGATSGDNKVVRGGSWFDTGNFTSTSIRFPAPPTESGDSIGFRCASDVVNEAEMIGQVEAPEPTATATEEPTTEPTAEPTEPPTATAEPTATATKKPTAVPTKEPTATPTKEPTAAPTKEPTAAPTKEPTATPTKEPTATPTKEPTATATSSTGSTDDTAEKTSASAPIYFYCDLYPGEDLGSTYVVGACDSLIKIARDLGVPYLALREANPQVKDPNFIKIGDVLTVPTEQTGAPGPTPANPPTVPPPSATSAAPESPPPTQAPPSPTSEPPESPPPAQTPPPSSSLK